MILFVDVETRCFLDLAKVGAYRYASDESAGVNCIAWAVDDGPVAYIPWELCKSRATLPQDFLDAWAKADRVVAHNAGFEIVIFMLILGLTKPLSQWACTMFLAAYYGYPRSLDEAAKAIGSSKLKDVSGKAVMLRLCKGLLTPAEAPDDFQRLYTYCCNDIYPMREIFQKLPPLPPYMQELWELDQEINLRGLPVDVLAIHNALIIKRWAAEDADQRMSNLTGGAVTTVNQTERIQEFVKSRGVDMVDCTANTVVQTLEKPLPSIVEAVLKLRQEAGLSSVAKYEQMAAYQVDGRLYQMFDLYGCHTGRPTGNGPQVLNPPRSKNPEYWAEQICLPPEIFCAVVDRPVARLKDGIRGTFKAPKGKRLVWLDLSQIEARATGWLAGAQNFLDLFMSGDPYCTYGRSIFGREITKADLIERTAAKATVLSMGFGGGIGAYQLSAQLYNLDMEVFADCILPTAMPGEFMEAERNAEYYYKKMPAKPLTQRAALAADIVKQRYRRDFPRIPAFWQELELAFLHYGGTLGPGLSIEIRGDLRIVTLPSGRQQFYHGVAIDERGQYSYMSRKGRHSLWYGVLMENAAQCVNFDISEHYKLQANRWIGPVVHHCYDSFMLEVEESRVEEVQRQLKALMATKPGWANGLPIAFDMSTGERYGK